MSPGNLRCSQGTITRTLANQIWRRRDEEKNTVKNYLVQPLHLPYEKMGGTESFSDLSKVADCSVAEQGTRLDS